MRILANPSQLIFVLRSILFVMLAISVPCLAAVDDTEHATELEFDFDEDFPRTIEEASQWIIARLPERDRILFVRLSEEDLIMFHHGFGTGIRNSLGLWQRDSELLKNCGSGAQHPDYCSSLIIRQVYLDLFEVVPPEFWEQEQATQEMLRQVSTRREDYADRNTAEIAEQLSLDVAQSTHPRSPHVRVEYRCSGDPSKTLVGRLDWDFSNAHSILRWITISMPCAVTFEGADIVFSDKTGL
jgi:hypothetical protein